MSTVTTRDCELVAGLEVHVQLLTDSKMFCRCSARYSQAPANELVCPVCLGMPGVLPVANQRAIEFTVMAGLALGCSISEHSKFDRKNYPYPDLMKGYQISQYDQPLCAGGHLDLTTEAGSRRVGITRIHLEEDTARLLHRRDDGHAYTLMDINRAGVPLMEIVTEPDLRGPAEARAFLQHLRAILLFLGVSDCKMEDGSMRVDINASVRERGAPDLGVKTEVKNVNSVRAVQRALDYELRRQSALLNDGAIVTQETRGWVEERGVTIAQRTKEFAHDYRYFPEPDLPPLTLDAAYIDAVRDRMPELPAARRRRYVEVLGVRAAQAETLTTEPALSAYFEAALAASPIRDADRARALADWQLGELLGLLNASGGDLATATVSPAALADLVDHVARGAISGRQAKDILPKMLESGQSAKDIIKAEGLSQLSDEATLRQAAVSVIARNPAAVADYRAGKQQALAFLVGQMMKKTGGAANPTRANAALRAEIEAGNDPR